MGRSGEYGLYQDIGTQLHNGFKNLSLLLCCKLDQIILNTAGGGSGPTFAVTQFTIGDGGQHTTLNGTTTASNPAWVNKTLNVALNGVGFLLSGTDFTVNEGAGSFTLTNSQTFQTGQTYSVISF